MVHSGRSIPSKLRSKCQNGGRGAIARRDFGPPPPSMGRRSLNEPSSYLWTLRSISYFFGLQLPLKIASLLSLNFRELLIVENCPSPASVKSAVSPALGQRYKTR